MHLTGWWRVSTSAALKFYSLAIIIQQPKWEVLCGWNGNRCQGAHPWKTLLMDLWKMWSRGDSLILQATKFKTVEVSFTTAHFCWVSMPLLSYTLFSALNVKTCGTIRDVCRKGISLFGGLKNTWSKITGWGER
jgi:hypothetical protein